MIPPLVGVAVKVTNVPEQIAPDGFETILTPVDNTEFIVIVMELLVKIVGDAQTALEVIIQVIISPFTKDEFE